MAEHIEKGKEGEDVAVAYLEKKGMKILHRNWRVGHKEIDIIAQDGEFIVFVEVKTRMTEPIHAVDVITHDKIKNIVNAAASYMRRFRTNLESRFDVLILTGRDGNYDVNYMQNAYRSYLR